MKIRIPVVIDLNLDGYRDEYGDEGLTKAEICDQIRNYLAESVRSASWGHAVADVDAR